MKHQQKYDNEHITTILTDEENSEFEGVTIDEDGKTYDDRRNTIFVDNIDSYSSKTGESFKIYSWSNLSIIEKVLLALSLVGVVVILISFGGLFLLGFLGVVIFGWILTFLKKLF